MGGMLGKLRSQRGGSGRKAPYRHAGGQAAAQITLPLRSRFLPGHSPRDPLGALPLACRRSDGTSEPALGDAGIPLGTSRLRTDGGRRDERLLALSRPGGVAPCG